jgi:Zn-dependent protease with chaperone function
MGLLNQFVLYGFLLTLLQEPAKYNLFSVEQDTEIGLESAKQADKTLPLVRDVIANDYFREMGARLARNSPLPTLPYRFRIVNSRDGDAVTFPGGPIYIDRRLIDLTTNEHELAALVAHEIAHAAARHGTVQLSQQLLVQSGASIAAGMLTRDSWKEQLAHLGISFGDRPSFLRYSESQEVEANALAVQILVKTGYSPYALSTIEDKINSLRGDKTDLLAYAYHHPQGELASGRLEIELRVQKTLPHVLRPSPVFRAFQASLAKLPFPPHESPHAPQSTVLTKAWVHPEYYYRLGYPEGWQVAANGTNGGIITPPGGRTLDNVNTGVIFDLFDIDHPMPLEQATDRLISYLAQNNQSPLDSAGHPKDPSAGFRRVPGAQFQILMGAEPALRTVMIGRAPSSQPNEIVWLVTRRYYQSLFYILCVAPEGEFDKNQPMFEQIIGSVELREH